MENECMSALTIHLSESLLEKLNGRAREEGTSVEAKTIALLEQWAQQQSVSADEFHRQVEVAREELERFRNTFRELSR